MKRFPRPPLTPLLVGLLALSACDPAVSPATGVTPPPEPPPVDTTPYVRIHYRLQGEGDPKTWGVHFFGAGTTSPTWGSPQLFDKTDEFGAYTDVKVGRTDASSEAWLGIIPVHCEGTTCKKDIETSLRFDDLSRNAANPSIAEAWLTQGQTLQKTKPVSTGPVYKLFRTADFIDLGDGSVRLMFHAAPGSTGTVRYGTSPALLNKQATWSATDDINTKGLILSALTPGTAIHYKISSSLSTSSGELKDESSVLSLTPLQFSTISETKDWASWGGKGVMYQLIVRTFADGGSQKTVSNPSTESGIDPSSRDGVGDLVGLKNTLPYLKELGVNALWLSPLFKATSYHGYDTTDFYDIDPSIGTRKDFADLTAAADAQGINIILDLVQNHVADVNPWFIAGSDPKHPDYAKYHDWFVWSDDYSNMLTDEHPFDPTAVLWACKNYMCYHEIFGGAFPELNFRNPEVRAEMKKISEFWLRLGADGFRLDASKHIDQFDDNHALPLAVHGTHVWWKEFNYFVKKQVALPAGAPPVMLSGENRWDLPTLAGKMVPYAGDMDTQFDFPFLGYFYGFMANAPGEASDFPHYLQTMREQTGKTELGGNANHYYEHFLSNHDLDRPATVLEEFFGLKDFALLKQAAAIILTVPGMPVIYYGEEFGKRGKSDKYFPTDTYAHNEFVREPMSWFRQTVFSGDKTASYDIDFLRTNAANAALGLAAGMCKAPNPAYPFIKYMTEEDPYSWAAQKDDPDSLFNFYKKLIAIRKANPVITDSDSQISTVQNTPEVFEYTLSKGSTRLAVVLNRTAEPRTVTRAASAQELLTGRTGTSFDVPAHGVLILQ